MQGLIPDQTSSRCRYLARLHVLLVLKIRRASPALVFTDGILHRLAVSGIGERLERDGDRNSRDHVKRPQSEVLNVAAGREPPRLPLRLE